MNFRFAHNNFNVLDLEKSAEDAPVVKLVNLIAGLALGGALALAGL